MNEIVTPRWEFRAFGPSFDVLEPLLPEFFEIAHETYILSEAVDASVKIRGDQLLIKTLVDVRHGLELWRPVLRATFPLCHREVREVCTHLGVAQPEMLFQPCFNAADFITDIACCTDGVHVIGVNKTRRQVPVDGCIVHRAAVAAAGRSVQTASIESADALGARRVMHRFGFDQLENVSYVEFLKRLRNIPRPHRQIHQPAFPE